MQSIVFIKISEKIFQINFLRLCAKQKINQAIHPCRINEKLRRQGKSTRINELLDLISIFSLKR